MDLPTILMGHPPLETCHKSPSGVAVHVMPGCACPGPLNATDAGPVRVPNHVTIWENGEARSISIEEARAAGLVV